jgi:hypothetical protein
VVEVLHPPIPSLLPLACSQKPRAAPMFGAAYYYLSLLPCLALAGNGAETLDLETRKHSSIAGRENGTPPSRLIHINDGGVMEH